MIGPDALRMAPAEIEILMRRLQEWTINDIARRIAKTGRITSSAEYQLSTIADMDIFNTNFKKKIAEVLNISEKDVEKLFTEASKANYIYDKRMFEAKGIPFTPFEENHFVQTFTNNIITQTQGIMSNITKSLGFAFRGPDGKMIYESVAQFYHRELDLAVTKIASGITTFEGAVKDSVKTMADSGLRYVTYESGHKDRIDVASRRAIMGGMRGLTNLQSDYNSQLTGSNVFEVSWHGGHRPSHMWGGRRFDITGEHYPTEARMYAMYTAPDGKVGTLDDYNCYHEKYNVFPDSPPKFTNKQLAELESKESELKEWRGKMYNAYEARQEQRRQERIMRRQNSVIAGYEGGLPEMETDYKLAKTAMRQMRKEYRLFSEAMGIYPEFERVNTGFVE